MISSYIIYSGLSMRSGCHNWNHVIDRTPTVVQNDKTDDNTDMRFKYQFKFYSNQIQSSLFCSKLEDILYCIIHCFHVKVNSVLNFLSNIIFIPVAMKQCPWNLRGEKVCPWLRHETIFHTFVRAHTRENFANKNICMSSKHEKTLANICTSSYTRKPFQTTPKFLFCV